MEEHRETDDCAVYHQSSDNGHNCGGSLYLGRMIQKGRERYEWLASAPTSDDLGGNPACLSAVPEPCLGCARRLTDSHDDEESSQEPSKVHHTISRALHEVIRVGCAPAYPVRQRRDEVCCDDEKCYVVVEERCAENYEEESDRKNL